MRNGLFVKLGLGCAAVMVSGGVIGMGFANYVTTGSFEFYQQTRLAGSRPGPGLAVDRAYGSGDVRYGGGTQVADAMPHYASLDR